MDLYQTLNELDILYEEMEHEATYTVEDMKKINITISGIGCKNLFLSDHKGHHYLYVLQDDKKANLKKIGAYINSKNLSFASSESLFFILKILPRSVSPLTIINDTDNKVAVLIDKELKQKRILVHPNINTKSISLKLEDLIKYIEYLNHKYILV